jgi:POT family proton-dependent oligopeptide transporter
MFGLLSFWLKGLGHGRAEDQISAKAEAAGPDQDARDLL